MSTEPSASVSRYQRKRDFTQTPEPADIVRQKKGKLSFVVQRHHARALHYDFRLELGGALKSWAVPKGPSELIGEKRLAVHVEDHPIEYGEFEGTIPEGQYGAGLVEIWDRGVWRPIGDPESGYRAGHLKFDLEGEKLNGRWALIRMKPKESARQDNWLLIRERASHSSVAATEIAVEPTRARKSNRTRPASKVALPDTLTPQLATPSSTVPSGNGWIYEIKFDGYRILARIDGGDAKLVSRNGRDWSAKCPAVVGALRRLKVENAWIDGEVVALSGEGRSDFGKLQRSLESPGESAVSYAAFDLLFLNGEDLRALPLMERKARLKKLLGRARGGVLLFSDSLRGTPSDLLAKACSHQLEGLIAKRADAGYASRRSRAWLKLKCRPRDEFVIGGYTQPLGSRVGLGALLLGAYEGGQLVYRGRVGTGLGKVELEALRKKLQRLETNRSPFAATPRYHPKRAKIHLVRPELVAEIDYAQITDQGLIRQGSFRGLRQDKPARSVVLPAAGSVSGRTEVAGVAISNENRPIADTDGVTKLQVVQYYESVAKWLLPQICNRPLSLIRCPGGDFRHCFYQRHGEETSGSNRSDDADAPPFIRLRTLRDVIAAVQNGAFEFHSWGSRFPGIDRPDRITLDLDPDPNMKWPAFLEACSLVRALLDELDLRWFIKTTGGKGLHFVLPLERRDPWDEVKAFSRALADHLESSLPTLFTAKMTKSQREGRVFVDYLRNAEGATAVAAYSLRARPGLPVSMPIEWADLKRDVRGTVFSIHNACAVLSKRKRDPWSEYGAARQRIPVAVKRLLGL